MGSPGCAWLRRVRSALILLCVLSAVSCSQASTAKHDALLQPETTSPDSSVVDPLRPSAAPKPPQGQGRSGGPDEASTLSDRQLREFRAMFGAEAVLALRAADGGDVTSTGHLESPYAWSTIKVLLAVRTIMDAGSSRLVGDQVTADIVAALTVSDNDAARRLWGALVARHGSAREAATALDDVLRSAGDRMTSVSVVGRGEFSPYGQTRWQPAEQVRFIDALARGCLLGPHDTRWLLEVMGSVTEYQRWGLFVVPGSAAKGGWGPDIDGRYLVRQAGVIEAGEGSWYSVAIAVRPGDGLFASGADMLTQAARWLADNVTSVPAPAPCHS